MKKIISFLLSLCILTTMCSGLFTAVAETVPAASVSVTRRGDDENKFGTYMVDEGTPQSVADVQTDRWLFRHATLNGTYILANFDKAYTIKGITICSSTDDGKFANRSVWRAVAVYTSGIDNNVRGMFNKSGLNDDDTPNVITDFSPVITDNVLFNLFGPGTSEDNQEGGLDTEGGGTYRMGIKYIIFDIEEQDEDVILSFDSDNNITGSVDTGVSTDTEYYSQGCGSTRMSFATNVGKTDNVGAQMTYYTHEKKLDLTKYDSFSIDVFMGSQNFYLREGIDICFVSSSGTQYTHRVADETASFGWHTYKFAKTPINPSGGWDSISRVIITYYSIDDYPLSNAWMSIDNLRGYKGTRTPAADSRGLFVIDNFEDTSNIIGTSNTFVNENHLSDSVKYGFGSAKLYSGTPTGHPANVGIQAFTRFSTPADLTSYKYFSFELYVGSELSGAHQFSVNFISDDTGATQDGYNIVLDISNYTAGWHTVTFSSSQLTKLIPESDMTQVRFIRYTWFNIEQINSKVTLALDDFIAYNDGDLENANYNNQSTMVNVTLGDIDDSNVINAVDALYALKQSVGRDTGISARQMFKSDVNADNSVTSTDALLIIQRSVGLFKNFGIEKQYYAEMNKLYGGSAQLKFNSDGEFKVLIIGDLHIAEHDDGLPNEYRVMLNTTLAETRPDLVVLNGDTISDGANHYTGVREECRAEILYYFTELNDIFKSHGAKWALTFGNHDGVHGDTTRFDQMTLAKQCDAFIGDYGYMTSDRVGNSVLPVVSSDGKEVAFNVWCLDTGVSHETTYNCANILPEEINWYKNTSSEYAKVNGGAVYGIMAGHILTTDFGVIYTDRALYGVELEKHEVDFYSNLPQSDLCNAFSEQGDIKGYYAGHDHINNYGGIENGIEFAYVGNLTVDGYGGVYGPDQMYPATCGARLITVNQDDPSNFRSKFVCFTDLIQYADQKTTTSTDGTSENILDFDSTLATVTNESVLRPDGVPSLSTTNTNGYNGTNGLTVTTNSAITTPYASGGVANNNTTMLMALNNSVSLGSSKRYIRFRLDTDEMFDFRRMNITLRCGGTHFTIDNTEDETPFYLLEDGRSDWKMHRTDDDGCLGGYGRSSLRNFHGWIAISLDDMVNSGGGAISSGDTITAISIYYDLLWCKMYGLEYTVDSIALCDEYWTFK